MLVRLVKSLVGFALLAGILVGIPAGLYAVAGSPIPASFSVEAVINALTTPDNGTLLVQVISWAGWLAWLYLAVATLVELVAQLAQAGLMGRGVRGKVSLPGFALPRVAAKPVVALALSLFVAGGSAAVSHAAPAAPAPAPSQGPSLSAPQAPSGQTTTSAPSASAPQTVHEVTQVGENLWDLAARYYGDGGQWPKIAQANAELVGPQGEHRLQRGWRLTIPDAPRTAPAAAVVAAPAKPDYPVAARPTPGHTYVVKRGDNLSKIATLAYGDEDAFERIVEANPDLIDDPDQIDIGWRLKLPAAQTAPGPNSLPQTGPGATQQKKADEQKAAQERQAAEQRAAEAARVQAEQKATQEREQRAAEAARVQAEQKAAEQRAAEAAAQRERAAEISVASLDDAAPIGFGAGGLLAAGLLTLLSRRWRRQAARRRPGQQIPAPTTEAAAVVTTLRQAETPMTVDTLDRAMRTLAHQLVTQGRALPALAAVRLDQGRVDCVLHVPDTHAPAPFTSMHSGRIWSLTAAAVDDLLLPDEAREVSAPYPALVTLGQADDSHILVDLESIAALSIQDANPDEVMAALAVELSTSAWADDLSVTIVGTCPELVDALAVDRTNYVDDVDALLDDLEREASDSREQLSADEQDHARQERLDPDAAADFTPHVLLIGRELAPDQRERLLQVLTDIPRVAVAAVTTHPSDRLGEWTLDTLGASSRLTPLELTVDPQRIDEAAYHAICAALAHSQRLDTEPAPWWDHDATDETASGAETATVTPLHPVRGPEDVEAGEQPAQTPDTPLDEPAETTDDDLEAEETTPAASEDVETGEAPVSVAAPAALHQPTLLLLGDVDLLNARGQVSARRSPAEVFEALAFIHLRSDCTTRDFAEAMAGRTSDANGLASRARRLLGTTTEGDKLFPAAERRDGARYYKLHPSVTSDWAQFQELIEGGVNSVSTAKLTDALALVRGRPIASAAPGVWAWADPLRERMVAAIVDTAHELATRALSRGDHTLARWAIDQGRLADSVTEILARDEIRCARMAGRHLDAQHIADRVRADAARHRLELDPETIELLHEIHDDNRRRAHG